MGVKGLQLLRTTRDIMGNRTEASCKSVINFLLQDGKRRELDEFKKNMELIIREQSGFIEDFFKIREYHVFLPNELQSTMEDFLKSRGYNPARLSYMLLNRLITLHQRKQCILYIMKKLLCGKSKQLEKSIFWEQRKLGDNIVEYTEKTTENNQYPVLTSSRKGIFFQTDYYDGNQIASADNTGYNIVPYGYFTYRHMSDDEIFHFNINDIAENGIVSTLYPVFTTDENLDSRYLQYQLNYGREFARYAILQKQGGSRTYMYLNKLRNLYLTVPTAIEEQKKISEYFTNLDHLITLHQRKP